MEFIDATKNWWFNTDEIAHLFDGRTLEKKDLAKEQSVPVFLDWEFSDGKQVIHRGWTVK